MALLKFQLTDLTTNIDLVYDPVNQTKYRLLSAKTNIDLPDVISHKPDDSEPIPIRAIDGDRIFHFVLDIVGTTQDEVEQKINLLKRWVDGANCQAMQYWETGDVLPIYLAVKKPYAANSTLAKVKIGAVDDGEGQYTNVGMIGYEAYNVTVRLVVEPYSVARRPVILKNDLPSSPHGVEDNAIGTLPDNWTLVNSPTVVYDSHHYLIGHKSVRVTTPSLGQVGVESPIATTASGDEITAYVWIKRMSGDALTVSLRSSAAAIMEKSLTEGDTYHVADRTQIDYLGETWYRITLQGIATDTQTKIRVERPSLSGTATTFWVDSFYLHVNSQNNEFTNPIMSKDTDGNGLADGLTSLGGTHIMDSSNYVTGGLSQRTITNATNSQGVTTSFLAITSRKFAISALVSVESGDPVTVTIRDSIYGVTYANKKLDANDTYGVADWKVSGSGNTTPQTFYRISARGVLNSGGSLSIDIQRKSSDATQITSFRLDSIYIEYDTLDTDAIPLYALCPPDGFCSTSKILNNYAPTTGSLDQINFVDTWGLPGDETSLTTISWTLFPSGEKSFYISRSGTAFKNIVASRRSHWIQNSQSGWTVTETTTNGGWTNVSNVALSGGSVRRFTASGGTGTGTHILTEGVGVGAIDTLSGTRHPFLLARTSSTSATISIQIEAGSSTGRTAIFDSGTLSFASANNLLFMDTGKILNDSGILRAINAELSGLTTTYKITFTVANVPTGQYVDIDALYLPYSDRELAFIQTRVAVPVTVSGGTIYIVGSEKRVVIDTRSMGEDVLGSMWLTPSGAELTRYLFFMTPATNIYTISDNSTIMFYCYPRTSHLLGVI